jgi:hypothetical protein
MHKAIRVAVCVFGGGILALLLAIATQELLFMVYHDQVSRDSLSQPWDLLTPIAYPFAWLISTVFLWVITGHTARAKSKRK